MTDRQTDGQTDTMLACNASHTKNNTGSENKMQSLFAATEGLQHKQSLKVSFPHLVASECPQTRSPAEAYNKLQITTLLAVSWCKACNYHVHLRQILFLNQTQRDSL